MRSRRLAAALAALTLWLGAGASAASDRCVAPAAAAIAPRGTSAGEIDFGNAAMQADDAATALAAYREGGRLARASGDERLAFVADANAARAAVRAGELDDVGASLARLATANAAFKPTARARNEIHIARTWMELANHAPESASDARKRAADALIRAEQLATEASDRRLRSYALGYLGELYLAAGRADDARALTRRALLEASASNAPDAVYRWHWQLARIARGAGERDAAIASYRSALAALARLRSDLALGAAEAAFSFRQEVEPAYVELVDLLLRAAEDGDDAARQALLTEARDTLESLKAAELSNHFGDACLDAQRLATPEEVPGTVVLYPVVLPDRVELILGTDAGLSVHHAPVDGATLTADAQRLRALITKRTTRQFLPVAQSLYASLIAPIDAALAGRQIRALVVVPGGALRNIPFAALHDAKTGKYLIEKVAVATSPGLTLTNPRPIDPSSVQSLIAGVSQGVLGFSPLDNVPSEVAQVSEAFPAVTLLDEDFLAARFEQEIAARPVGIVHVASHGEFSADASQSFILAHDRKISMDEFASTVGRTRLRTDAPLELLVLSACQTATGDDRAALGLAGVALRAGARSALATLWSVNDEASATLVTRFYRELASGASRATALQRAQQELLAEPVTRHPAYWSPFLLISSWL